LTWHRLVLGQPQPFVGAAGPSGLTIEAVPAPGKVPLHLEGRAAPTEEDNVGVILRDQRGRTLAFVPSAASGTAALDAHARAADCLVFDGTFFREDELPALGLGTRGARDMAHWPLGGDDGSLRWLAGLPCRRKILIHVNNTNPILCEDAPERAALAAAGVEVAYDGLQVEI
jgi:pyrroloquinoline quinone biosynthesis protein B